MIDCRSGSLWQIFADNENSLILNRDGNTKPILQNASGSFDGVFDKSGSLYIVSAISGGSIDCVVCDAFGERSFSVVSSKNSKGKISGIRVFCINGRFSLWYCLEYDGKSILVNQFFDADGNADAPFAVDTLGYKKCFAVCCDANFDTHVFYVDKDEKSRYLIYKWSQKKFDMSLGSCFDFDNVVSIDSICDGKDIHISFVAKRSDYYGVYYKRGGKSAEHVLGFGVGAGCTSAVCAASGKVTVYWCDNFGFFECFSTDGGKTFEPQKRINDIKGGKNVLCGYRSKNNYCIMCVNKCIYSSSSGRILHEKEISAMMSRFFDAGNDLKREIINFSKEGASDLKVGIDLAARLESIETCLMKMLCILEQTIPQDTPVTKISADIGETYEENIELFNNIDVDKI